MPSSPQAGAGRRAIAAERVFSEIYREHSVAVYSVAARIGGSARADDVVQEVFLRLWRGALVFDPSRGSLRTFLLAVTRNLSLDQLRSNNSRRAREDQDVRREPLRIAPGPESQALAAERTKRVLDALAQLSTERREAIVVAFFGGITYREAAVALGEPEGTVKSRIRAALKQLGPLLH